MTIMADTRKPNGYWTRERMIEAVERWIAATGERPTSNQWNASQLRTDGKLDELQRFYDLEAPHGNTVMYRFGSWGAFMEACGLRPLSIGEKIHVRNRKTIRTFTCIGCGVTFDRRVPTDQVAKYHSIACYRSNQQGYDAGYIAGWRRAMAEAKGGGWSDELPPELIA